MVGVPVQHTGKGHLPHGESPPCRLRDNSLIVIKPKFLPFLELMILMMMCLEIADPPLHLLGCRIQQKVADLHWQLHNLHLLGHQNMGGVARNIVDRIRVSPQS